VTAPAPAAGTAPAVEPVTLGDRLIGPGEPAYVIAELSANHQGSLDIARQVVRAAARAGADAVKLQTYTADTMTIDSDRPEFLVGEETLWGGRRLHELYRDAFTPWDWYDDLQAEASEHGLDLFSTPFDETAVAFLEERRPPAYKIASFELVDLRLIERVAATGRPMIMSTGMASAEEIDDAVGTARRAGARDIVLLRCNSGYPAPPAEMDLATIPDMASRWEVPVGLSDHTLGTTAAVAAVAIGATVVEKHLTLDRDAGGPDAAFSLEPDEFALMVTAVREAEAALGTVRYGPAEREAASLAFRRSLFVVADVSAGEILTEASVRSIRPGHGLAPRHLDAVLGRVAAGPIERGTPLSWDLLA
jgi:N-acetylneuraminate synthase